jgi:hypothetical protein
VVSEIAGQDHRHARAHHAARFASELCANAVLFSGAVNEQEAQVMHAVAGKLRARGLSVTECVSADGHEHGPGVAASSFSIDGRSTDSLRRPAKAATVASAS